MKCPLSLKNKLFSNSKYSGIKKFFNFNSNLLVDFDEQK